MKDNHNNIWQGHDEALRKGVEKLNETLGQRAVDALEKQALAQQQETPWMRMHREGKL